eukprot:CAMPEP_0198138140 /NCGR_PEP_ID=MMETSP1443-20131203/1552_1 /TAXON_ID=186043 /ORGANISM="Entomoneis sp., Strain CCMP2396" /LENGTH=361 /DNA_ID=CAMNT_0043799787 /DNA_START=64 /DNA_END=1149 /DNA_ORIENTATION=-
MPDGLEVSPDDELRFVLTSNEAIPKAILTLKHPAGGSHSEPFAFKVKTTQPRRYLVRPNQGLIQPGQSEEVQILMVEKDKVSLLQSFERLGQSALDSSKDKFLVQSTRVGPSEGLKAGDYEKLSNYWTKVMSNTSAYGVFNTKLPVKLVAEMSGAATTADVAAKSPSAAGAAGTTRSAAAVTTTAKSMPKTITSSKDVNVMSSESLRSELSNLRHKYDELVSFSVNLTAERDILNNTLEQTKRELNKYLHKTAAKDNRSNATNTDSGSGNATGASIKSQFMYVLAFLFWFMGAWMAHRGQTKFLSYIPVVKGFFPLAPPTPPTPVVNDEPAKTTTTTPIPKEPVVDEDGEEESPDEETLEL